MPFSSKAIPRVTSAESVASFYSDMLGVVEGGEEECEENDEVVIAFPLKMQGPQRLLRNTRAPMTWHWSEFCQMAAKWCPE